MATINPNYGTEQSLTVTNLHSLASSATAGWSSAATDNTSTKWRDAFLTVVLDPANTAPASDKGFYVFGYGAPSTSRYPSTGASSGGTVGTQGALTFPNVSSAPILLRLLGFIPYGVADTVITFECPSVCVAMRWSCLPPYWGIGILNYSGAALAASGNAVYWLGYNESAA